MHRQALLHTGDNMIIDTHAHIGKMIGFNMPGECLLKSMDKYGIDFSLFSDIEAAEYAHNGMKIPRFLQKKQNKVLKNDLEFVRQHSDRLGLLVWLKTAGELPDCEMLSLIEQNRDVIYGVKLHPFHSRTSPDDPKLEPVYDMCRRFSLPVVSHTGGCAEAMSDRLYNAAKAHPDISFVMVHMDLGTDNSRALDLLGELPNLYGDTTWVPVSTTLEAVRRYGSKKMLFGTDNTIDGIDTLLHNKTGDRSLYQEYFNELKHKLSREEYDDLMYKNAVRLFGVDLPAL